MVMLGLFKHGLSHLDYFPSCVIILLFLSLVNALLHNVPRLIVKLTVLCLLSICDIS